MRFINTITRRFNIRNLGTTNAIKGDVEVLDQLGGMDMEDHHAGSCTNCGGAVTSPLSDLCRTCKRLAVFGGMDMGNHIHSCVACGLPISLVDVYCGGCRVDFV